MGWVGEEDGVGRRGMGWVGEGDGVVREGNEVGRRGGWGG